MKVYSPSSTLTYMRCPQLWAFQQGGWQSKVIANVDCAAAVGLGIGHGLECQFKGASLDDAVVLARALAIGHINDKVDKGGSINPACERAYGLIEQRVEKALRRFAKEKPLPEDWSDFRPELVFPDHGNCRVDLLHNSDLGPCITDFKTKVSAAEYIVDNFMFDAETSWQMYHYVYAARQMGIKVESFAICLIVIEPFHVYLEQWLVDEQYMEIWEDNAKWWWYHMEEVEGGMMPPMRVGDHRDKYGLCSMYNACFGYAEMGVNYMKRERHN